jgi:hypothetical protein
MILKRLNSKARRKHRIILDLTVTLHTYNTIWPLKYNYDEILPLTGLQ